jgi:hypothetical protein
VDRISQQQSIVLLLRFVARRLLQKYRIARAAVIPPTVF